MNDRDKAYFQARVSREMDEDLKVPELAAPEALAAACRILAREARDFLLQRSIVRGTFAYWARRAA